MSDTPLPSKKIAVAPQAAVNPPAGPPHHYVVREPFGGFRRGDRLDDQSVIDAAHEAGHGPKLIRVNPSPE